MGLHALMQLQFHDEGAAISWLDSCQPSQPLKSLAGPFAKPQESRRHGISSQAASVFAFPNYGRREVFGAKGSYRTAVDDVQQACASDELN